VSQFLTMPEASVHCGGVPSPETLYRLAREGHLPVRRIGRRLVISERLLDQWVDSVGDVRATAYPGASLKECPADFLSLDPPTNHPIRSAARSPVGGSRLSSTKPRVGDNGGHPAASVVSNEEIGGDYLHHS
jgi:hypothetical protein